MPLKQYRGTWGAVTVQSAWWDGDTYDEDFDADIQEFTITISLVVTWNS